MSALSPTGAAEDPVVTVERAKRALGAALDAWNERLDADYEATVVPAIRELRRTVAAARVDLSDLEPRDIIRAAARRFDVRMRDILGNGLKYDHADARHVAMYLARTYIDLSYPKIGEIFERDHSTAMYGVKRVAAAMKAANRPDASARTLRIRNAVWAIETHLGLSRLAAK